MKDISGGVPAGKGEDGGIILIKNKFKEQWTCVLESAWLDT